MSNPVPFPILEYDDDIGMITPALQQETMKDLNGVDTCVMVFFPGLDEHPISKELEPWCPFTAGGAKMMHYVYQNQLVVANLPAGGAPCAQLMEELISLGLSRFICIGSAGMITEEADPDKLFVVTEAIRDEGTSYHYLPAGEQVYTSPLLRTLVEESFDNRGVPYQEGTVWTTDAIYRETSSRVSRRKKEGAAAVDMECASLCAVAQYRGVEFVQVLYFSDYLHSDVWSGFSRDYEALRIKTLRLLLEVGMEVADK